MSNSQSDKVISITLNGSGLPVANPDPAQVQKDNQKVRWCADFQFTITIDGYDDLTYNSGGSGCTYRCTSGTFGEIKKYKYSITANGQTNDPELDIRP